MQIHIDHVEKGLDDVTIYFTFVGDMTICKGKIGMSQKEYKASGNGEDLEYLVKCVLARELHHLVNGW